MLTICKNFYTFLNNIHSETLSKQICKMKNKNKNQLRTKCSNHSHGTLSFILFF